MWRPPWGLARVVMVAPWAVAIARTMDRPRPCPLSFAVRVVLSRWKGSLGYDTALRACQKLTVTGGRSAALAGSVQL